MITEVEARKIGNSIGFILQKEVVDKERIKPGQKLTINIVKKADLTPIFGMIKTKESTQKIRDELRKGWE